MPKLNWISDHSLITAVKSLLEVAASAKDRAADNFSKNVIDPFSAIFEMAGFNMTYDEWMKSEEARQAQKTLQNFIGQFHQIILGSCDGWVNMGTGNIIDLVSAGNKIVAEVKNKYNTTKSNNLSNLYKDLESAVMNKNSVYKDYTAYYVSIIPKKPERYNKLFTPSDNQKGQKCVENPLIRHIDGSSFYTLVTGDENALEDLYDVLPTVITEITNKNILDTQKLKSLFKLAYA